MNEKNRNIELTNTQEYTEDITVDSINETSDLYSGPRERVKTKESRPGNLTLTEMSNLVHSYDHPEIKDWPKRPYKTILIVFLLLFSGILFTGMGFYKYSTNHTYDVYLPYSCLGILLLFPGVYYTFVFINILLDREGYDYSELPDLSD